jgi:hypothetical protein
MLRVISLVVALLLISGWVMPAHSCTETKQGATIHCAELPEFDTYALLVQDGTFIVGLRVLACSPSFLTLNPQLLVSIIYRPPQL